MGEVIELHPPPKDGEPAFLLCPCTPQGTEFLVTVIMGNPPVITSLDCPACENTLEVVNGEVQGERT